jgi:hypothetical protein
MKDNDVTREIDRMTEHRKLPINKRIRELAEQAGYKKDMFGVGHWDLPECKRFAELIIKECVEVVKWTPSQFPNYVYVKNIQEHFGVE